MINLIEKERDGEKEERQIRYLCLFMIFLRYTFEIFRIENYVVADDSA